MPKKEENVWNRFSSVYDRFMKKDEAAYQDVIQRIVQELNPEDHVLEIATGTGIIALGLAHHIKCIEAIDFAPDMIKAACKKSKQSYVTNINFSVTNAYDLPYASDSFDAVIIANTLHIMPNPKKALAEIRRVLKTNGLLFAPTFIHAGSKKAAILSQLMSLTGFRTYHKWTMMSFQAFLEENGFSIVDSSLIKASFPLAYVVAKESETL
jgi:ubiquinone/menaquinone biosynthesis C-methylase UbiE